MAFAAGSFREEPLRMRCLFAIAAFTVSVTISYAAEFIPLGDLPGRDISNIPRAVSDDGNTVVGQRYREAPSEAFIWRRDADTVWLEQPTPRPNGAASALAFDVSADGSVVVGRTLDPTWTDFELQGWDAHNAFMWTADTGLTYLGNETYSATAVSSDGTTIVGQAVADPLTAHGADMYRSVAGELTIVTLPSTNNRSVAANTVTGVSRDGSVVVGGLGTGLGSGEAYRWTEALGLETLGVPGEAEAISADGSTIAIDASWPGGGALELVLWNEATGARTIGTRGAPAGGSAIRGINGDGTAVVGFAYQGSVGNLAPVAFIWTEVTGFQDLSDYLANHYGLAPANEGWEFRSVQDISANGLHLAVGATNPNGDYEAVLIDLDPDFDGDFRTDVADLDLLAAALRAGETKYLYDMDGSGQVNSNDLRNLITDKLGTWFGDSDLDGEFSSNDLVNVFQAGEYEDAVASNSGWATGDWNGDGEFGTADLVTAFQDGGYEQGLRPAAVTVPEPASFLMLATSLMGISILRRRSIHDSSAPRVCFGVRSGIWCLAGLARGVRPSSVI